MSDSRLARLAALVGKYSSADGMNPTAIEGLRCLRMSAPSQKMPTVYQPSLCLVVQGRKRVLLEGEVYHYSPSRFLVISVDLPLVGQVLEASVDKPYLCLQMDLDPAQLSELITPRDARAPAEGDTARGLFVGAVDEPLLDAALRLTRLLETPRDIPALAPMVMREIHYRILSGAHGGTIAGLAVAGSNLHKIAQVIRHMKANLAASIRVEELAATLHMSASSFHHHFKAVTAMSPLQYHKRLRLTEARQILLSENTDAASTAYRVGYESASQFSREYARMFGAPPVRDVTAIKAGVRVDSRVGNARRV